MPRVAILMPVYDEGDRLERTLTDIAEHAARVEAGSVTVFVVDDGSPIPVSDAAVGAAARRIRVILARHAINLGQGAALETARRLALDPR